MELKPHPARYNTSLLPVFARVLAGHGARRILDPMCGVGRIFELQEMLPDLQIEGVELEPEWAAHDQRITLGDALNLPWPAWHFDAVVVSPAYGNRMADGLMKAHWNYVTYAQYLGRKLSPGNGGSMQWGTRYRVFHLEAWQEARRVLRPGGLFVLNIKDHVRAGEVQPVTEWHISALKSLGFELEDHIKVACPGMRRGSNYQLRAEYESVVVMRYDTASYRSEE